MANSEIEYVFNNVVNKNRSNSFIFQKETMNEATLEAENVKLPEYNGVNGLKYEISHQFLD